MSYTGRSWSEVGVLLCRDAVSVFYIPGQLGESTERFSYLAVCRFKQRLQIEKA